ncbi:cob(I)yrinic acid a,c-diamide adenosyltransferase [Candidatus Odyssella acanthamoebae]|uniref:Corrinoid adenosyltransferase n=1 Tax=Candidatus Odyssella acanthamoebae TaxID=91604 RepID=A0A077AQT4_9PROT|nr:cob(I)yrinic acid a,c-diamide adenosyltransferase [Candidatus Paracaedibacter acanthamoebae]AIK95537.1 cob(I)yrinic acid a c-diamide adenosyltransferase [Candidatus Paracaedibacter acanthamoebae]
MVQLTRIYTRGGDKGKASLGDGTRIYKSDLRMEAIGSVDEANASLGLVMLHAESDIAKILFRIQNDLFDVGADLCMSDTTQPGLRIVASQVTWLEHQIDHFNESLSPLNSFVLPGGTQLAAYLHLARTIVRRAERVIVALSLQSQINLEVVRYINRLSDLLFVLSRYTNNKGLQDVLWVPGANR